MTPARAALTASLIAFAALVVVAVAAVPWDAAVAPWARLDLPAFPDFTADQVAAINAYVDAAWLPGLLGWLAGPVAALAIWLIAPLRRAFARIGPASRPMVRDLLVAAAILAVARLAALPFAAWLAQVRRDAGLLVEPWTAWWLRWLGESAVYVALGALAVAVGLAALRRWPRRGWIAVALGAGLVTLVVTALLPFAQRVQGTTADPQLTARVLAIADRAGVDVGAVSVISVADTSPAINANVSGWGPTRTVTVYDTVAPTMSDAEIDALIAHELIHVREGDAVLGALLATLGVIGTVALACALVLSTRLRTRASAVPLVVAVVLGASLAGTVIGATISRPLESRADREALALVGDPQAYRDLIVRLATTNRSTLEPPSWRYALVFTHPTPLQRLHVTQRSALGDRL